MLRPKDRIDVGDSFIAVIRNGPQAGKELGPFQCNKSRHDRVECGGTEGRIFLYHDFEIRKVE